MTSSRLIGWQQAITRGGRNRRCRWLVRFVALALGLPLAGPASAEETIIFFHQDALGSVRLVTGNNGEVLARHDYLPFGEELPADQFGRASSAGDFHPEGHAGGPWPMPHLHFGEARVHVAVVPGYVP
jgi:hypothetical protein